MRRGAHNIRSPPSDSSATEETPEQRIQRVQRVILTRQVQQFSMNHQLCRRVPLFFTPSGQPRLVQDVAKDLVGNFLICRESDVVVRIVETEAYQEHEEIYRYKFPQPPLTFRNSAGVLVSYPITFGQQIMLITAGADNSGDLVLLRTCNVVFGVLEIENRMNVVPPITRFKRTNMMTGPTKVGMALAPDLSRNCNLLAYRGLHLLQNTTFLVMFEGPRMLPRDTPNSRYSRMNGANSRFRFACESPQKLMLPSSLLSMV